MPAVRKAGSTRYLGVVVTSPVPISSDPVYISVNGGATLGTATWTGASVQNGSTYTTTAQILLGPNTTPPLPAAGTTNQISIKITDNPEIPVIDVDLLQVTP